MKTFIVLEQTQTMLAMFTLLRPANALMSAFAVLIGGLLVAGLEVFSSAAVGIAMLAAFLIAGAGNAINDYCDVEADKINRPRRPIPSGRVSKHGALSFSLFLFAVGILLSLTVNYVVLGIAIFNSLLLIAYSTTFQHKFFLGNLSVSLLVGTTFLFGGAAAGSLLVPFILAALAFFATLAREIVKDLEDVEGDKQSFLRAMASKILSRFSKDQRLKHRKALVVTAAISLILAILISPAPYVLSVLGELYLVLLIPTDLFFLVAFLQITFRGSRGLLGKKKFTGISKNIKIGMLFGLLAFVAGSLI